MSDSNIYFYITGGTAITYRDTNENFIAIGIYIAFTELESIHQKVIIDNKNFYSLSEIFFGRTKYFLTKKFIEDYPNAPFLDRKDNFFKSNVFKYAANYFFDKKTNDTYEYIQVCGLNEIGKRIIKFIRRDYIAISDNNLNFDKYKVLFTSTSDIDWIKPVNDIDTQLYRKYGLTGTAKKKRVRAQGFGIRFAD